MARTWILSGAKNPGAAAAALPIVLRYAPVPNLKQLRPRYRLGAELRRITGKRTENDVRRKSRGWAGGRNRAKTHGAPAGSGNGSLPRRWWWCGPFCFWCSLHPLMAIFSRWRAFGREWLDSIDGPVIFAANHLSVADNPAVLLALPWRWRLRVATAASVEVMRGRGRVQSFFAALISNSFLFSQTGSVRASLAYCDRLTGAPDGRCCSFPKGCAPTTAS